MSLTKNRINSFKLRLIIFCVISVLILCTLFTYTKCENFVNNFINPILSDDIQNCDLKVHFIDVKEADCILIELPDNKLMLVDSGTNDSEERVISYIDNIMQSRENLNIDYFVLTHIDSDHVGGADKIFEKYNVLNCFRPNVIIESEILTYGTSSLVTNSPCYVEFVNKLYEENCNVVFTYKDDNLFNLSSTCEYGVKFLAPLDENPQNSNDYSAVIMIEYAGKKILLTADIESDIERKLVDNYGNILNADILKVAHHGSKTSSTSNFVSIVSPSYAIISVGKNNYGHPDKEVIETLENYVNKNLYRTDRDGDIVVGIDKDDNSKILVNSHKRLFSNLHIYWWSVIVLCIIINYLLCFYINRKKMPA